MVKKMTQRFIYSSRTEYSLVTDWSTLNLNQPMDTSVIGPHSDHATEQGVVLESLTREGGRFG